MAKLETYGLPADLDCETFVLGAVLKRFDVYYPQVADLLVALDFSISKHQEIWRNIVALRDSGQPVDRVTVYKAIAAKRTMEAEELSYLAGLDDLIPEYPNVSAYAARVREKSTLRQAIVACQNTIERLCDPRATSEDVISAEKIIRKISESQVKRRRLLSAIEVMDGDPDSGGARAFLEPSVSSGGILTPWTWLNHATGGFKAGNLVILAARPSVGKTSAAAQMAMHLLSLAMGLVFVSLEMPSIDILRKMVAGRASISLNEWVNGELDAAERLEVQRSSTWIRNTAIYFDDQPRATVPGIHATVLRHMADHEVRLVVVDYLQLLTAAGRGSTRTEDVSEITRDLKLMAMQLGVPVIALSQLSRASVKENRRPRLDDLRDSGSIEQDADIVLFLHRLEKPFVELIVAKQRLGPIGEVRLVFDRKTGMFSEAGGLE
jgi:replicative DNA helicase